MASVAKRRTWISFLASGLMLAAGPAGLAQQTTAQCADDAMLVFDGSGSMAEMGYNLLSQPRIFDAREALRLSLPNITPYRKLGLIIYGPGSADECSNIDLRFKPQRDAASRIIAEVDGLAPAGKTPLTSAVLLAAETLLYRQKTGVVVLVTDGKETCGGKTCNLASKLATEGKALTVHVIGFKVRGKFFNWQGGAEAGYEHGRTVARCLADLTGGKYLSTENVNELAAALQETLACPVIGLDHSRKLRSRG